MFAGELQTRLKTTRREKRLQCRSRNVCHLTVIDYSLEFPIMLNTHTHTHQCYKSKRTTPFSPFCFVYHEKHLHHSVLFCTICIICALCQSSDRLYIYIYYLLLIIVFIDFFFLFLMLIVCVFKLPKRNKKYIFVCINF